MGVVNIVCLWKWRGRYGRGGSIDIPDILAKITLGFTALSVSYPNPSLSSFPGMKFSTLLID
jgi:hypothetical protein